MYIHLPLNFGHFSPTMALITTSSVIAFIVPYVTALVNNRKMSDKARIGMAWVVSFLAACIQVALMGEFSFADLATALAIIYPLSQTFYRNVALKLGVRQLENATSPEDLRDSEAIQNDRPLSTSSTIEAAKDIITSAPAAVQELKNEAKQQVQDVGMKAGAAIISQAPAVLSSVNDAIEEGSDAVTGVTDQMAQMVGQVSVLTPESEARIASMILEGLKRKL